jgi:chromosome segregation ATPase
MITKIKELMQIKDLIDDISKKVKEQEKAVVKSNEEVIEFKKQIIELNKENSKALKSIKKDSESIKSFKEDLKNELYDFKLFKKEIQEKFIEKIDSDIGSIKNTMKKDVSDFNETKKKLDLKLGKIEKLDNEINKLTSISKNIKVADFDLVKHKKNLDNNEKEKLELLNKIDNLERLCAKFKRRR